MPRAAAPSPPTPLPTHTLAGPAWEQAEGGKLHPGRVWRSPWGHTVWGGGAPQFACSLGWEGRTAAEFSPVPGAPSFLRGFLKIKKKKKVDLFKHNEISPLLLPGPGLTLPQSCTTRPGCSGAGAGPGGQRWLGLQVALPLLGLRAGDASQAPAPGVLGFPCWGWGAGGAQGPGVTGMVVLFPSHPAEAASGADHLHPLAAGRAGGAFC